MNKLKILSLLKFSIRVKLLLASTILLIIPIIGFQYIKELETFLREDQQQRLLENVRTIASVISSQKIFQSAFKVNKTSTAIEHVFVRPLSSPMLLDGFNEEWQYDQSGTKTPHLFKSTQTDGQNNDPLNYGFLTGYKNRHVYIFFQVKDKHLLYQPTNHQSITNCDHILIVSEDNTGKLSHYVISTHSPGDIQAKQVIRSGKKNFKYKIFSRIKAVWQETAEGYNVEVRMPRSVLGNKVAFAVIDLDNKGTPEKREIVVASKGNSIQQLSSLSVAQPKLNDIVKQLSTPQSRTWLINANKNVVAVSGSIYEENREASEFESPDNINLSPMQFFEGIIRLLYQSILPQIDERFFDDASAVSTLTGKDIDLALSGTATTLWRSTDNSDVNILRAVFPVYSGQDIIGAVAVEKNSNSILLLQNRAVEILMNTSIVVFLLSTIILVSFASRLSYRIRRLRDETNNAIGSDGKIDIDNISNYMLSTRHGDEIDDLQRSYADMLIRLGDYNRYLESMASKLSHELRTPITVVKSSLENIEHNQHDDKNNSYIQRASDGVNRLNDILTRMSEATRLEQSLKAEQKHPINISKIVSGCVEGYKIAHGQGKLNLYIHSTSTDDDIYINGCAELIAQLLDKLVSNALDFSDNSTAIIIALKENQSTVTLSVSNSGSSLPEQMQSNLFESMVSVRDKRSEQPHLGLGLYIVRLIAEFHDASPYAHNISVEKNQDTFDPEQTVRLSQTHTDSYHGVEVGVRFNSVKDVKSD